MNAIVARMEERITDTSLIVENRNTCDDNSPTVPLTEKQIAELRACAARVGIDVSRSAFFLFA